MRCALALFTLLPLQALAAGAFEGVIEMKVDGEKMHGSMTVKVSPLGARSETHMENVPVNHVVIRKKSQPDAAVILDANAKTWAEMDMKRAREMTRNAPEETFTVKKLGTEKLQGYVCDHIVVTGSRSGAHEMWVTKEIGDSSMFQAMGGGPREGGPEGLAHALRDAGVDGFPMKAIHGEGDHKVTMEVVKLEKKSIPASEFEVPAGYTRQQHIGPPGVDPAMMEKMKNASPEERRKLAEEMKKKMMEQYGNQPPPK